MPFFPGLRRTLGRRLVILARNSGLSFSRSAASEHAWGSRGVFVAQDMSQTAWQAELKNALGEFQTHPHILQQFHQGRLVEHDYLDASANEIRRMRGRVRLCPYYFVGEKKTVCGGALATICPDDKKLLHGMTDAILVPAAVDIS